jgi:hypothetical protein
MKLRTIWCSPIIPSTNSTFLQFARSISWNWPRPCRFDYIIHYSTSNFSTS